MASGTTRVLPAASSVEAHCIPHGDLESCSEKEPTTPDGVSPVVAKTVSLDARALKEMPALRLDQGQKVTVLPIPCSGQKVENKLKVQGAETEWIKERWKQH